MSPIFRIGAILVAAAAAPGFASAEELKGIEPVIGPLTMLPEFQKAFSCRAGSPMTTAQDKRCEVW